MTWMRTPEGYELAELGARLVKRGRAWWLVHAGREVQLGRRATFDTAERAIMAGNHCA